jgi:hypothetical protein
LDASSILGTWYMVDDVDVALRWHCKSVMRQASKNSLNGGGYKIYASCRFPEPGGMLHIARLHVEVHAVVQTDLIQMWTVNY